MSAEEALRGAPAQPGSGVPSYETTPVLDGKLITETAETAYKAKHEPRVPLMLNFAAIKSRFGDHMKSIVSDATTSI